MVEHKVVYGIFGKGEATYDEQGFTDTLVVIQESGLFAGAPPLERRIHDIIPFNDKDFGKQWVAKLNRHTDLPFYLAKARVKVLRVPEMVKWTDEMLQEDGLEPLKDEQT